MNEQRGPRGWGAILFLAVRTGVLRRPVAVVRVLRRYGGSLPAAIELGALRDGARVALVRGSESRTYAEVRRAVRATAAVLARDHGPGARIGVRMDHSPASVVMLAAGIAAGLETTPLGPRLSAGDVAAIVDRDALDVVVGPESVDWTGPGLPPRRTPGHLRILSTGSTGIPAATARSRLGVRPLLVLAALDREIAWPPGPVLVLAPLDHGHGLSAVLAGLVRGQTVLLAAGLSPAELADVAEHDPPTAVTGVPLQLIRAVEAGLFDHGRLRRIVSGSSTLDDAHAAQIAQRTGASIIDCLGSTETGTFAVRQPPAAFRPLPGVRIAVGPNGTLRVRSPLARRESGAATGAEWIATGDVGRLTSDGLRLDGRADGLVDSAGELIALDRVREAILALPGVRDCRVDSAADDLRGTVIMAEIDLEPAPSGGDAAGVADDDLTPESVRSALLPTLGRAQLPHRFRIHRPSSPGTGAR